MTRDSIGFANGTRTTMLGAGGSHYGWHEKPSFQVVSGLIMSLLSYEEQLLKTVGLIVQSHPSIINARAPDVSGGGSLLHFVILNTNHPGLLELLLEADCRISMTLDKYERSPLRIAVENGKWRSLQLLLSALRRNRFSILPEPMRVVNGTMQAMAYKYPLDFLSFLSSFELQPEPEVLGDVDASDVMLPRRLIKGTASRCPKGTWNDLLKEYRVVIDSADRDEMETAALLAKKTIEQAGVVAVEQVASPQSSHRGPLSMRGSMGAASVIGRLRRKALNSAQAAKEDGGSIPPSKIADLSDGMDSKKQIALGYSTVATGSGVQAYRVPFEDFAALPPPGSVAPLQLIVEAVSASTRSDDAYTVFGSTLIEILLEFKWKGFARRKYLYELIHYLAHVLLILAWNILSNEVILDDGLDVDGIFEKLMQGDPKLIGIAVLYIYTTSTCVNLIWLQIKELSHGGMRIFQDPWNVMQCPSLLILCS